MKKAYENNAVSCNEKDFHEFIALVHDFEVTVGTLEIIFSLFSEYMNLRKRHKSRANVMRVINNTLPGTKDFIIKISKKYSPLFRAVRDSGFDYIETNDDEHDEDEDMENGADDVNEERKTGEEMEQLLGAAMWAHGEIEAFQAFAEDVLCGRDICLNDVRASLNLSRIFNGTLAASIEGCLKEFD